VLNRFLKDLKIGVRRLLSHILSFTPRGELWPLAAKLSPGVNFVP
jgi:hypothetical protein